MSAKNASPPLPDIFSQATRDWFTSAFQHPTLVQSQTWAVTAANQHALVIAPTGSGKTLAAFLYALDRLFREGEDKYTTPPSGKEKNVTRILYISPIKALGTDVQHNLQIPLQGISEERRKCASAEIAIRVGIRTGDTPPQERAKLSRHPPDILITTPESLYLMLTSRARESLRGVETVIVDEVHAVAGTKRGAHLALSLERLDALLTKSAQRIGLSATVRSVTEVAAFLGGDRPVTVVNPPATRHPDIRIVAPAANLDDVLADNSDSGDAIHKGREGSVWPRIESGILDQILSHRSTIVFTNSRGLAEKLTARLNELYLSRRQAFPEPQGEPVHYDSSTGSTGNRAQDTGEYIARSHHGSVSKEQRAVTEHALKSGELRCVVATSSLELGIDMGAVDLVIQVATPLSVASGLQRIGRASHQVGGVSKGLFYPRTRRDLVDSAVIVECMYAGELETLTPPRNPLDILAQQTVATVSMDPVHVDDWYALVRRASPWKDLPRSAFDATLDMLAGRYPSGDFAVFRPRIIWNRETGLLTARPGAQLLAVTSGGTIPDRGMFSVLLPEGDEQAGSRRVGELDEEMVYESRVNDIITLGASSWRIQQITRDQVIVVPAPGRSARLPFWRGEGVGRPAELGERIGDFIHTMSDDNAELRLSPRLRDDNVLSNIKGLIDDQKNATGVLPWSRHLVLERCRDEMGDWRVILHSPYGRRVHAPWALAIGGRLHAQWGADASIVASDDGIVARLPDSDGKLPDAALFLFEPEKLLRIVREAVSSTALFAARFRECAARALLMPGRTPGRRSPLWQQRLRASQLLEIAAGYPDFPIILETARECLQDVYDLDALEQVIRRLNTGEIQISEVTTPAPSPFATDLLFGYVAEFMYATDAPLAERRASVLALDSELLGNLLGQGDPLELLDPEIIRQVEDELQRRAVGRKAQGMEGVYDLLRELGPMTIEELAVRHEGTIADVSSWLDNLSADKRIFPVVIADTEQMACMDDAARLRDALGVRLPASLSSAWLHPVNTPLRDLFMRFSRTHTLFTGTQIAQAFGLGVAVADDLLRQLRDEGVLIQLRSGAASIADDARASTWVNEEVFHRLRIRSLHAAREATRPVPATSYARLLLERQGIISPADGSPARLPASSGGMLEGSDGVTRVIEQLAGIGLSASLWESQIFPARVRDYSPDILDELLATGEVIWSGQKKLGDDDGQVVLHLRDYLAETLSPPSGDSEALSDLQRAILDVLSGGGAWFAQQLSAMIQARTQRSGNDEWITPATLHEALWGLVWQGYITTDIWAPLRGLSRTVSASRQPSRRSPRMRRGRPTYALPRPTSVAVPVSYTTPALTGRWSLLPVETLNDTERMLAWTENMLDRYGVIGRQAVITENVPGGFPALQTLCRSMEDSGRILRGRFVEGMGGAQFAERHTIDRLRDLTSSNTENQAFTAVALSANDPANPWGTLLPWPTHPSSLVPARRNGAFVVISAGQLRLYLAQGGKKMMVWSENEEMPSSEIFSALASALRREPRLRFTLTEVNDTPVRQTTLFTLLREVGFSSSPQGLDWG
ncbi:TPA: ATP-dependent helicase [Citrobacter farmeri]|uniref:ATP-dependent helicase n=1 Tax=Citrobacter farmeri TaxID=67824 RepID=A0A8H9TXZ0_9ENTR|nr:ATP-dependent helicase [Citrobacter farmeri]MCP1692404.1 ATP-dependent Lhr-like helicase [Citrobacter farmeri]MCW2421236.1 ATP-dependent Lhr-like helicase [Citrobacter farmeri]NTY14402.1 ATP-dependent helicase [Citrobacter farmeri]QXA95335.1 ATP-dependent helicase [Citrobacter farmeri]GAL48719.1 putative ATP-dependent helicase Lhr [Citrobacter farmeri GTC 1319]